MRPTLGKSIVSPVPLDAASLGPPGRSKCSMLSGQVCISYSLGVDDAPSKQMQTRPFSNKLCTDKRPTWSTDKAPNVQIPTVIGPPALRRRPWPCGAPKRSWHGVQNMCFFKTNWGSNYLFYLKSMQRGCVSLAQPHRYHVFSSWKYYPAKAYRAYWSFVFVHTIETQSSTTNEGH